MPPSHSGEPGRPLMLRSPVVPVWRRWSSTRTTTARTPNQAQRASASPAVAGPGCRPRRTQANTKLRAMAGRDRKALEERTRYDPSEVEPRVLSQWLEAGIFHPDATGTPEDNFSIAIPPPNVTGELHMGHALNGTLQDVLTRKRRMEGRRALWALGTDHAGIATQVVVERQLVKEGTSREELGREEFERRVWEWREQYGSKIVEQYKRLGASCDYERERFTMDEAYVRAVYKVFKSLFDKGYIYRDNYMVNWDPGSHTAISDLEVEYREVEDTLY